jgi:hypothetical protein
MLVLAVVDGLLLRLLSSLIIVPWRSMIRMRTASFFKSCFQNQKGTMTTPQCSFMVTDFVGYDVLQSLTAEDTSTVGTRVASSKKMATRKNTFTFLSSILRKTMPFYSTRTIEMVAQYR